MPLGTPSLRFHNTGGIHPINVRHTIYFVIPTEEEVLAIGTDTRAGFRKIGIDRGP